MNKIFMLAKGNIRKAKGQMIILATLFLIAACLLIMGLSVLLGFGTRFDELVEELNASDAHFNMSQFLFTSEVEDLFRQYSTDFEVHSGLDLFNSEVTWNDDVFNTGIIFYNIEDNRRLSQWKLVGEYLPLTHNSVYVPYMLRFSAGYNLGDVISVVFENHTLYFTVSGFVENIWVDAMGLSPRVYIPQSRFEELYDLFPNRRGVYIYVNGISNVQNFANLVGIEMAVGNTGFNPDYWLSFTTLDQVISSRTGIAYMMSVLMVSLTFIIAIVSIMVIRFRIKNSIEEDMPKIGSLMSIGYTSRQIKSSIMAQYVSVVFISVVLSIIPAVLLLPFVGQIFAVLSGLYWQPGFMPLPVAITVLGITSFVFIFTTISARGIKKITPVLALRGGVKTHNFKRNPLPLDKSPFSLNITLAFKSVFQNFRQSVMMFIILFAVTFTSVIALVIFYNASVDITAFEQVPGIERMNSVIAFTPDQDNFVFQNEVNSHPDVRDTQFWHQGATTVSNEFTIFMAMEDFDRRVTRNVFEGIFPRYTNEIAITWLLAQEIGASVGDLVYVGDDNLPFLVTGFLSGFELGPFGAFLTFDGALKIFPDIPFSVLGVYLNPGTDASIFGQEMEAKFYEYTFLVLDFDEQFERGVSGFANIMSLVGVIIITISAFVILLVLYFVISSTIVRKYRDLGIQKAIGFTTINLMNQISLTFSFPIFFGSIVGAVLGVLSVNPLMLVGMRTMGVMQSNLIINIPWVISSAVIVIFSAYFISMLVTWRIKKISAYELVTE